MATDVTRLSFDAGRQYTAVAPQQGRVTLEADENEARSIALEERRKELLDLVGPAATPDGGYAISAAPAPAVPYDFQIGPGIMYVGGNRVELDAPILYSAEPDWLDHDTDFLEWNPLPQEDPGNESVVLVLTETDVTATEDPVLREVALGGPDSAARTRLLQRVRRLTTQAGDCAGAWAGDQAEWYDEGLQFDPATGRLQSQTTLQVTWDGPPPGDDPCQPTAKGGYLGAENQAIRVQVTDYDPDSGAFGLLWGWDNASFLYRVTAGSGNVLTFDRSPVDDYHRPAAGQAVQLLRSAAALASTDAKVEGYVAALSGIPAVLTAPYDPDTKTVQFPPSIPSQYLDAVDTPQLYLRVWQGWLQGNQLGQAVSLPGTGLSVTLSLQSAGGWMHTGDYWTIGVRPSTPDTVLPARLLREGQPPDGPQMWACPLAVIGWSNGQLQLLSDCRNPFPHGDEGCCCTVSVTPAQAASQGLQSIIDAVTVNLSPHDRAHEVTVCLSPGLYELTEPLLLTSDHNHLRIEGCGDAAILAAAAGSEASFADGLITMIHSDNVTLSGLELRLPLIPAGLVDFRPNEKEMAVWAVPMRQLYRDLDISIGIRPIHCAMLAVEDCLFRLVVGSSTEAFAGNVFGVGIFAGSECWGMRVERCRFLHDAEHVRAARDSGVWVQRGATTAPEVIAATAATRREVAAGGEAAQMLVGVLLMPSLVYVSGDKAIAKRGLPSGSLVRTLLTGARITGNEFRGLSVGVFAVAEIGQVQIEDNEVRDCYGGVWLLSIRAQAYADVAGQYTVAREVPVAGVKAGEKALAVAAADERAVMVSAIARTYPLPRAFLASGRDKRAAAHVAAEAHKTTQLAWMKQFVEKSFAPFVAANREAGAAAAEPAASAEPAAAAEPAPTLSAGGVPPRNIKFAAAADNLQNMLGAFDLGAAYTPESRRFELRIAGNDIECGVPFGSGTGPALLVWADAEAGSALIGDNRLISDESDAAAMVVGVPTLLCNSNLVVNTPIRARSLTILGAPAATVTGNVLDGTPVLPPRSLSAPFDSWDPFNTIVA